MTTQDAYNKGLDVAENEAYEKLSKALEGYDVGPFNNPKMEEIRQKVLFKPFEGGNDEFINLLEDAIKTKTYGELNTGDFKTKIISKFVLDLMKYNASLSKRTSVIGVKLKNKFVGIKNSLTLGEDRLNLD